LLTALGGDTLLGFVVEEVQHQSVSYSLSMDARAPEDMPAMCNTLVSKVVYCVLVLVAMLNGVCIYLVAKDSTICQSNTRR